jgi:polyhydroxybutyrate depolymerase
MSEPGGGLDRGEIRVAGVRRTFWLARAPQRGTERAVAPLLIVLHGSGMDGRTMARFTGLATRGPAAGITVVFPDGWRGAWHPARPPDGEPDLDDARFLSELATHMEVLGAARSWPVFLAGVSQGARYAEHVARHGLLPVTGLFLVAGTALEFSRRIAPVPLLHARMIIVMGTGDRTAPYEGGPLTRRGLSGAVLRRRAVRHGELPGEDVVAGVEAVTADWAAGNGITGQPLVEELPTVADDLPVTRKTWSTPGCHEVTAYRIDGGGHGWPGGPQFMPARVIGPISRDLDATGLLIEMARQETAAAAGHNMLDTGSPPEHDGGARAAGERGALLRDALPVGELPVGERDAPLIERASGPPWEPAGAPPPWDHVGAPPWEQAGPPPWEQSGAPAEQATTPPGCRTGATKRTMRGTPPWEQGGAPPWERADTPPTERAEAPP